MESQVRDFILEVELERLEAEGRTAPISGVRVAPPMTQTPREPIADADRLGYGEDYAYDERPAPIEDCIRTGEVDEADMEWASAKGLMHAIATREGATFLRISEDVFIIAVIGGQYLHDDRHLADIPADKAVGLNEHSWYLVVEPSDDQMLLVEVKEGIYEHMPFRENGLLYMDTVNRHLVSRRSPRDMVVLVQVSGYGQDQRGEAVERIRQVLAARPDIIAE